MNRKQIATTLLGVSVLFSSLDAAVTDWFKTKTTSFKRGAQCAFAPGRYNCSAAEKSKGRKWLIGVSVGAAAAAATAIGIGVTVNEIKKQKALAEAEEQKQQAEQDRQRLLFGEQKSAAEAEARAKGASEAEIKKLLAEIGEFNDTPDPAQPGTTGYYINVVKNGPKKMREAFNYIKDQVSKGALKTKEGIQQAYISAVNFTTDSLPNILQNALDVSMTKVTDAYKNVRGSLATFMSALNRPPSSSSNLADLASYLKYLAKMKKNAKEASSKLSGRQKLHAKTITPREYIDKRQKIEAKEAELRIRKRKINDQKAILAQGELPTKFKSGGLSSSSKQAQIINLQKKFAKEEQEIQEKMVKLAQKKERDMLKEQFDVFASPKNWADKYFPGIRDKVMALNLEKFGTFSEALGNAASSVFAALQSLHRSGGKLGQALFPNVQTGLETLKQEFAALGRDLNHIFNIKPILIKTHLTEKEVVWTALKLIVEDNFALFQNYGDSLSQAATRLKTADLQVDALKVQIEALADWFSQFKNNVITDVQLAVSKGNIRNAAQLLRRSVIEVTEKGKGAINSIINGISVITKNLIDALAPAGRPGVIFILLELNGKLKGILGEPLINQRLLTALQNTITARAPGINEAIKSIKTGTRLY